MLSGLQLRPQILQGFLILVIRTGAQLIYLFFIALCAGIILLSAKLPALRAARRASSGQQVQSKQRSPAQTREDKALDAIVQEELRKREKRRKLLIGICAVTAACSLGYVGVYSYYNYRTEASYQQLGQLKDNPYP